MPPAPFHTPVLLREVLSLLITAPGGTYVDATLGGGGHSAALLELDPGARLIGMDADADALAYARNRLINPGTRCEFVQENFGNLTLVLSNLGIRTVRGILFDLGVSSFQLDEGSKGFSFRYDEPLDMRMDRRNPRDAQTVLRDLSSDELARVLRNYGEEKHAARIARKIVERRKHSPIRTTGDLSKIVGDAVGPRFLTKSLARVFQAVRIEVNDELRRLEQGIASALEVLEPGGRIVVIAYHSLEDRIVKQQFRAAAATSRKSGHVLMPDEPTKPRIRILTGKPLVASTGEQRTNPRSRSAKLRAAERI